MEKKKIIIAVGAAAAVVALGGAGYMYNESTKSTVAFNPVEHMEYGESIDALYTVEKADSYVAYLTDENGDVVDDPAVNVAYNLVVDATSNGVKTSFTMENVVFTDSVAPVITVENEDLTVDFGASYDLAATAADAVDGDVSVEADTEVDTKKPGTYTVGLKAVDASGNEATTSVNVTVLEPTCAENGTWNGEDCSCNEGYTGDGWTACTLVPKPTAKPTTYTNYSSNNNTQSWNNTAQSWDSGNTWTDNSSENTWSEPAQNGGGSTASGNTSVNGWSIDIPTENDKEAVISEGYEKFGEGVGWGGWITTDGTRLWD